MAAVSVILPVYDNGQSFFDRIANITEQSFHDMEVIVICGNLSNNDEERLALLMQSDERIRLVRIEKKVSLYSMWKKGLEEAKGRYFWIADVNNSSAYTFLQEGIDILSANEEANGVMFDTILIDKQKRPLNIDFDHWKHRHIQPGTISIYNAEQWTSGMQYWHNFVYSASSMIARRSAVKKDILVELNNPYTGAWVLWTSIGFNSKIIEVHKRLNHHFVGLPPIDPSENSMPYTNEKEQCAAIKEEAQTIGIFNEKMHISFINKEVRRLKLIKKVYSSNLSTPQKKILRQFIYSAY